MLRLLLNSYVFRIGYTEQCPCGTGSQTSEHLLQSCPVDEPLRKGIWPDHTPVACKLYGSDAIPPSSRRLEFPFDEEEKKNLYWLCLIPFSLGYNALSRGFCMMTGAYLVVIEDSEFFESSAS